MENRGKKSAGGEEVKGNRKWGKGSGGVKEMTERLLQDLACFLIFHRFNSCKAICLLVFHAQTRHTLTLHTHARAYTLLCLLFSRWLFYVIRFPWRSTFFRQKEVDIITRERWRCLHTHTHTHVSPTGSRPRCALSGKKVSETALI